VSGLGAIVQMSSMGGRFARASARTGDEVRARRLVGSAGLGRATGWHPRADRRAWRVPHVVQRPWGASDSEPISAYDEQIAAPDMPGDGNARRPREGRGDAGHQCARAAAVVALDDDAVDGISDVLDQAKAELAERVGRATVFD
jgi:hypothetical protein